MLDLNDTISQAEFGRLVGVSKAAVSGYLKSGLLKRGDSGLVWLRTYLRALEKAAADAAPSGLTAARTDLAQVRAEQARLRLDEKRTLLAPTPLLRQAMVGYASQASRAVSTMSAKAREIPGFTAAMRETVDEFVREMVIRWDGAGAAFDAEVENWLREQASGRGRAAAADD